MQDSAQLRRSVSYQHCVGFRFKVRLSSFLGVCCIFERQRAVQISQARRCRACGCKASGPLVPILYGRMYIIGYTSTKYPPNRYLGLCGSFSSCAMTPAVSLPPRLAQAGDVQEVSAASCRSHCSMIQMSLILYF